ncbi:hypothetical protein ACFGWA_001553, partial [Escherichia coli]
NMFYFSGVDFDCFLFIANTIYLKLFARCMFKTFWSGYGSRVKKPSPSHRKNCASMLRIVKVFCATFAITMFRNARVICVKMAGSAGDSPGGEFATRHQEFMSELSGIWCY